MRGLVGMEVVSLQSKSGGEGQKRTMQGNSHKVVLEEILQLSLSGRIGEVSNVESSTLGGAGDDGLVLRGVDGLVAAGSD